MNIQSLPEDVTNYLFSFLTSKNRADICSVSKWFESTAIRVSKQLSATPELYHWNPLHILTKKRCKKISLRDYHLMVRVKQADRLNFAKVCKTEDTDVIKLFIDNPYVLISTGDGLYAAAKTGNINIVNMLLPSLYGHPDQLTDAVKAASKIGNMEILKLLLEKNKIIHGRFYPSISIYAASKHGHIEIVRYLLNIKHKEDYLESCLGGASKGGHLDIINLAIVYYHDFYANNYSEDIVNDALSNACSYNHPEVINRLIELGATYCNNCKQSASSH